MKIRYLWVDAVCIIQPDNDRETEDWLKESAHMANYYSNAYLCIAASSAEDSSEGILVERPVAKFPFREWCNPGGGTLESPHDSRRLFRNPLLERGWCLQEWLLSPRILHWTRNGLIWQCKKGFIWESERFLHDERPDYIHDSRGRRFRDSNDCLFDMGPFHDRSTTIWQILESTKQEALGDDWSSLIHVYSKMNFTKPGDRLAAIQGIATYLSDRHKVGYFGGIFENQYLDGLLWARCRRGDLPTRIEGVPSWSWASAKGAINIPCVSNQCSIPWMRWVGGFPSDTKMQDFEKRSNRQIRVTAPLVPLPHERISQQDSMGDILFKLDSNNPIRHGIGLHIFFDYSEFDPVYLKEACLLFLREVCDPTTNKFGLEGIIVKRSLTDGDNMYQRIGIFNVLQVGQKEKLGFANPCLLEDWRADVVLV
jgi:hypothetical protein